ncbi:unnamed protein product [Schistosoma mattheei]|uniref:Uncharacterized protein n=1 Tax=Schistosoma mattheei TaxID=31246 RepID=A0A183P2J8_9TREM|nr:unnamed protein product [Schistosoma mattheei]
MRCSRDSCISNEITYKYMKGISSVPNPYQNSDFILSDIVCANNSFISSETLIKCEEQVLNELKSDYSSFGVALDNIRPHKGLITNDILNDFDKYVSNGSNSSPISDVYVSDVGYSHN